MKKKKLYQRPQTAVMQVELESPICSGSVDITNEKTGSMGIEAQQTNNSFDAGSQLTGGNAANGWDYTGTDN